jgi:hypothetical protein
MGKIKKNVMKVLFNYANLKFYNSQKLNTQTGLTIGGFDKAFEFRKEDIDQEFYQKNKHILDQPRGAGYWLWKFHFVMSIYVWHYQWEMLLI